MKKRLTGAILDSSAGLTLRLGSGAEVDTLLTLLASFTSFFHDTMVVSPGRSSTVNICRSPLFKNDDGGLDESTAAAEGTFSSAIGTGIEIVWRQCEDSTRIIRVRETWRRGLSPRRRRRELGAEEIGRDSKIRRKKL